MLEQKSGDEVILGDARRLWKWWAAESISLTGVAQHGIKQDSSKVCAPMESVWLQAIEILPCTPKAIESLESAPVVQPA